MLDDESTYAVRRLLFEHVRSPSLRHIRDPYVLQRLAADIVKAIEPARTEWVKWTGLREALAKSAALLLDSPGRSARLAQPDGRPVADRD